MIRQSRQQQRDDTRTAIVAAAMALFERNGFDAVTVEEIAAVSGVAKRTVFRHFATKADIVLQPILIGFRILPDTLADLPPATPLPEIIREIFAHLSTMLDAERPRMARHIRVILQSPQLATLSRSLSDAATADLRKGLAARMQLPENATAPAVWAELLFGIAFGARDSWIDAPERPIGPIIAASRNAAIAFLGTLALAGSAEEER